MRNRLLRLLVALGLLAFQARADQQADNIDATLALIKAWLGGTYSNQAQVAADAAADLPQERRHMPLHQVIVPVSIGALDGLTYFDQLSGDGTDKTIMSVGIYQFTPDPKTGTVRMRLLMFKDSERFADAYRKPEELDAVTLDDLRWTDGCEFFLTASEDASEIRGGMQESSCFPVSRVTGEKLRHVDELVIMPTQIWNKARYYDMDGNLLFGNSTGEFAKQVRIDE